jgi:hypothetical protein
MDYHWFSPLPPSLRPYSLAKEQQMTRRTVGLCLVALMLLLAACNGAVETPPADATAEAGEENALVAEASALTGVITEIDPYPANQTAGPVRVQIPEIGLDAPIIAMGWRVAMAEGQRTTVWEVPLDQAGWHINSVGAGGLGNTVVSGRQVEGAAVFAPLALGTVAPGQEVLLTDGDGIVFVYRIAEVTEPIPVTGATPDQLAQAAEYFAPTTTARLTLVTGWPEFTTTHRIFAVADFVGVMR